MSTYLYLQCLDHTPPLQAEDESGQHLYDLPAIRKDIARRVTLVDLYEDDASGWNARGAYFRGAYFRGNTVRFLAAHPACRIGIVDEYGKSYSTEEEGS